MKRLLNVGVMLGVAALLVAGVVDAFRGGGSGRHQAQPTLPPRQGTRSRTAAAPAAAFASLPAPPRNLRGTLAVMTSDCWLDFVRLDSGRVQRVGGSEERCGMLASAAGRWLAVGPSPAQGQHGVSVGPAVWLVNPVSGRIQPVPGTACMGWYAVGDDGRIAACGRDDLRIVARNGHVTRAPPGEAGVFLRDQLLIDTSDSIRSSGRRPASVPPLKRGELPLGLGVGADGSIALAAVKDGHFSVIVATPERSRVRLAVDPSVASGFGPPLLSVSRGGKLVAIQTYGPGGNTKVELAGARRGRVALATAALPAEMSAAAFAPDGCCTAIAAPDGIVIYTNEPLTPRWFLPRRGTAALAWLAAG